MTSGLSSISAITKSSPNLSIIFFFRYQAVYGSQSESSRISAILFVKSIVVSCSSSFSSKYSMSFLKIQLFLSPEVFIVLLSAEHVICSSEEKHTGIPLPVRRLILLLLWYKASAAGRSIACCILSLIFYSIDYFLSGKAV